MEIVGFEWKQHRPKHQPSSGEESHLKAVSYFLVSFNGTLVHANADMFQKLLAQFLHNVSFDVAQTSSDYDIQFPVITMNIYLTRQV